MTTAPISRKPLLQLDNVWKRFGDHQQQVVAVSG